MRESYLEARITYLDQIELAYKRSNLLRHALRTIQVPTGLSEPDLYMYINPGRTAVWLHSWPMEAGCGFVAELEELLLTAAIVHIDSNNHTIDHTFYKGTPFEFMVYVSPTNCVWKGEPQKYEWKDSTERPVCG